MDKIPYLKDSERGDAVKVSLKWSEGEGTLDKNRPVNSIDTFYVKKTFLQKLQKFNIFRKLKSHAIPNKKMADFWQFWGF